MLRSAWHCGLQKPTSSMLSPRLLGAIMSRLGLLGFAISVSASIQDVDDWYTPTSRLLLDSDIGLYRCHTGVSLQNANIIALACASMCIVRNLESAASPYMANKAAADIRRRRLFDFGMCVVFPLVCAAFRTSPPRFALICAYAGA